jgi:hypothetical protein
MYYGVRLLCPRLELCVAPVQTTCVGPAAGASAELPNSSDVVKKANGGMAAMMRTPKPPGAGSAQVVGVGSAEQRASSRQSSGDIRGHWVGKEEITKGAATPFAAVICDAPAPIRSAAEDPGVSAEQIPAYEGRGNADRW